MTLNHPPSPGLVWTGEPLVFSLVQGIRQLAEKSDVFVCSWTIYSTSSTITLLFPADGLLSLISLRYPPFRSLYLGPSTSIALSAAFLVTLERICRLAINVSVLALVISFSTYGRTARALA